MNPSRRDVLRVGAAAGGALVLELALPGCGAGQKHAVQLSARAGDFVPNAWLRITPQDTIVFTLDRVEMGQGTMTSHAQLVAEELDVDPARLVVELAHADRAYDNPDSQLGVQLTGGSTSVKTSFVPLRQAAASAREMLVRAAAVRWGVPFETCRAEDGSVVHASGRRARYGDLAADAARQEVPEAPRLKAPNEFKWIGKSVGRLDARMKVDGSGIYGIDVSMPGLLAAVVLRPPVLRARLVSFDAGPARAQPGFIDAFEIPQGVAVVAERYWQARRAADLVRVQWSEGARHLDTAELRRSYLERSRHSAGVVRADGDIHGAERKAARVIEATFEAPFLAHATMEPQNATAWVTEGRCEVWAPTQTPGLAHEVVHRMTGLPYDSITVHQTLLGGGFGRRLEVDYVEEAVQVALRVRRPVKVTWSREEDMRGDVYRPMALSRLRGSVGSDGAILGWRHRIVTQSLVATFGANWLGALAPGGVPLSMKLAAGRLGASFFRTNAVTDPTSIEGAATMAYTIPNTRFEYAPVVVDVPIGSWRSVGNSHNVFVVESFLDELARAAGKDPFEIRRSLLPPTSRERGVLELAGEKARWGSPLPPGRHRGVAQAMCFGSYCAHVAEVSVAGRDVRVHRIVSAVDCGVVVNPEGVRMQVESAIAFGLGAALQQQITLREGRIEQGNFHEFEPLRMNQMPDVEVHIVPSREPPSGVGEPGVPPVAPAVANAILAATGRPVRCLPISRALAEPVPPL